MKNIVLLVALVSFMLAGCNGNYGEKILVINTKLETIESRLSSLEDRNAALELRQDDTEEVLRNSLLQKKTESKVFPKTKIESRAMSVKDIQSALKKANFYDGPIDGKRGAGLTEAVKKFQRANGLKGDGIAGAKTKSELIKYLE